MVIENAYLQLTLRFILGDLYITDEGVTFVAYSKPVRVPEAAGFAVGGLAGGLGITAGNKQAIREAKEEAELQRSNSYFLTIAERVERYEGSEFMPRADVSRLEYDGKHDRIRCVVKNGGTVEFIVPKAKEYEAVLSPYPSGVTVYDANLDPHGIVLRRLGLPSPSELVQSWLTATADLRLTEDVMACMAANPEYMFKTYSSLKEKDPKTQKSICTRVGGAQPALALSLANAVSRGIHEARRNIWRRWMNPWATGCMVVFGGIGIAGLSQPQSDMGGIITLWFFVAVAAFILIMQLLGIRDDIATMRLGRRLVSILSVH